MLTDCSSIQGSTASSSSDVMTLTTTSSWCAMSIPGNASTRLRILRLIRPHTRRILVTPGSSPSFGFAVRGGKEFGSGFFVSNVERNSEAELKGMRIGDQILRINGFRVDDAVHKEFVQFISNNDRITLKVRSVGMLPTKDKEMDKLSWQVVKTSTLNSSTASEQSFKSFAERGDTRSKDVRIVLNVAPRTKLGLGICKGPEWKPGIFVQFTKEKSVAREAGLRPGDQILSVNSIDFSDVLFSEAVAVMKSANKLEMMVRTAAGCDLFPGESSGYNSSASSVTGDQSPCWADAKSKRLTAVCEEPTAACWNEQMYMEQQQRPNVKPKSSTDVSASIKQQVNKTIIKLSENGTSINNTYITNSHEGNDGHPQAADFSNDLPPPPPPPSATTNENIDGCYATRERETKTVVVEVHRHEADAEKRQQHHQQHHQQHQQQHQPQHHQQHQQQRHHQKQRVAPSIQDARNHYKQHSLLQPTNSMPNGATKVPEYQKCARTNSYSQHSQNQIANQSYNQSHNQSLAHSHSLTESQTQCHSQLSQHGRIGRTTDGNSTLSSAITEELKKRKEKQRINAATANHNNSNNADNSNNNNLHSNCKQKNYGPSRHEVHQQHQHQHNQQQQQTLRQQVSLKHMPATLSSSTSTSVASTSASLNAAALTLTSARTASGTANCSERNNESNNKTNHIGRAGAAAAANIGGIAASVGVGVGAGTVDQHSALMDEFKRAHQRMFKNGFQETERKERQEVLRNTEMMEDEVNHRASRIFRNNENSQVNNSSSVAATQLYMPPPPPQFASSPPPQQRTTSNNNNISAATLKLTNRSFTPNMNPKPPSSPVPDYDNIEIRSKLTAPTTSTSANGNNNSRHTYGYATPNVGTNGSTTTNGANRRTTMRLGTVTIGEYEQPQQRKEPAKFDFVGSPKRNGSPDESLHTELQNTLTRSKLKKSAEPLEHQSNCPLRSSYENYENVTRKLHGVSLNENGTTPIRNCAPPMATNGILKNGNGSRNTSGNGGTNGKGNLTKNSDKTISFGN